MVIHFFYCSTVFVCSAVLICNLRSLATHDVQTDPLTDSFATPMKLCTRCCNFYQVTVTQRHAICSPSFAMEGTDCNGACITLSFCVSGWGLVCVRSCCSISGLYSTFTDALD